ncbi:uncharacterized protein [Battus philenor]|uniref:uncharacterized protein n=1 Tax=Battus philenor TaxID=42288 RepID=UPI0035CECAAB
MDNILIDAVYRREPIWNPDNDLHKNSNVLKKLWQEVADEVNKDAKSSKTRWKNLRAYFVKECTKVKSRSVEGGEATSSWQYFDQLQFLRSTLPGSNRLINYTPDGEYNGDEIFITNYDGTMAYPETWSPGQSSSETSYTTPSTRKRKLKALASTNESSTYNETLLELERKKLKILENDLARGSNDDLLFFESLLPYMREIPVDRKLQLRSKIQDLICSEFKEIQQNTE